MTNEDIDEGILIVWEGYMSPLSCN